MGRRLLTGCYWHGVLDGWWKSDMNKQASQIPRFTGWQVQASPVIGLGG